MKTALKFVVVGLAGLTGLVATEASLAQQRGNPDGWEASLGAGVVWTPRSLGSKKMRTLAVPSFDLRYKDWFFASPIEGVGLQTTVGGVVLAAAVGADLNSRDPAAGGRYANLSSISIAPALRLKAVYEYGDFSTEALISSRIARSGRNGTTLALEEGYELYAAARTLVTVGLSARFMDGTFARNLVSVSATDAASSGLPVYRAKSGLLDAGLFAQVVYPIDDHWTVFSKIGINTLEGDARKSPLAERRTSPTALLFASYAF